MTGPDIEIPIDPMRVGQAVSEPISAWLAKIGAEEVEHIKEDISIPVEATEINGVIYIIRSKPGEPPRTETGALLKGVDFIVEKGEGPLPELLVFSERVGEPPDVPQMLDGSDGGIDRPYMSTAHIRLRERLRT